MLQTTTDLDLCEPTGESPAELAQAHLVHALWATIEKIGSKQKQHAFLERDASHSINLRLSGDIDGRRFSQAISSVTSIGCDLQKISSVTPALAQLTAFVLSKLNQATREHILKSVPVEFAANNQSIPHVDETIVTQASDLLGKLRAARQVTARAAVRCQFVF